MANYRPSTKPEWIILGIQRKDGVSVYAASDLISADLRYEMEPIRFNNGGYYSALPGPSWCEISATSHSMVGVHAPTYAEALRDLFRQWNPSGEAPDQLPGNLPELQP